LWLANNENAKGNSGATMIGEYFDKICEIMYPTIQVNGKKFEKYLDEDMEDGNFELAIYNLALSVFLKKEMTTLINATKESGDPTSQKSAVEKTSTGFSGNPLNPENSATPK
jgi:hypothetical protein